MMFVYKPIPKCIYCHNEMIIDDIDYNFKGNQDEYFYCTCGSALFRKIRYGKPLITSYKWKKKSI